MSSVEVGLDWLASPARARSLLTVRAAISSARSSGRPWDLSPLLMWSYWRWRLALQADDGMSLSSLRGAAAALQIGVLAPGHVALAVVDDRAVAAEARPAH